MLVSGSIAKVPGDAIFDLRMKYSICVPGVNIPSGRILVYSLVVAMPSQPVRVCGTALSHAGTVPSHLTFCPAGPLAAASRVSTTKQRNLAAPSIVKLGSDSWYIAAQAQESKPGRLWRRP